MFERRPFLSASLILLAALLVAAAVQSAIGADETFPTLRLYLAAHAVCYALLITAHDQHPPLDRFGIAASFAGATMAAVMAIEAVIGLAVVNSRAVDFLAVVPLAFVVAPILLVVASVGTGLGYGLSIAAGRVIWFPGRSKAFMPGAILHALWGMVACFAVAVSIMTAMGMSLHGDAGVGFYTGRAVVLWLVSLPHLALAWRFDRLPPSDDASAETSVTLHRAGLAAAVGFVALFLWSLTAPLLSAVSDSVETTQIGDRTYFVPSSLIKKKHLGNLSKLDRRWIYLRMELAGPGLEATTFNVHVVEQPARDWQNPVETLDCARNLFGGMSGCWRPDAMDWDRAYPFPKPTPDSSFEFNPPHVVSRIDIVVLDGRRRYQAVLSGLTGQVYLDDGRATWEFRVPDRMLKDLDKIVTAARAFQARLKQDPSTGVSAD